MIRHKYLLFLIAFFILLSLACGDLTVPVDQGAVVEQPPGGAPSDQEQADPLPTLAPLPGGDSLEAENESLAQEEIAVSGGADYIVGDVGWTILDAVELGAVLESGNPDVPDLTANGSLYAVRFTIENEGSDLLTFIGLNLEDGGGKRYGYLLEGQEFIIEEEVCDTVELEPGVLVTCTAIYDMPTGSENIQAVFTDLNLLNPEEQLVPLDFSE